MYRLRIPGISFLLINSDILKYVLKSRTFRFDVTSLTVRFESVKLTNLSKIDKESLIDPSDLSAINDRQPSSYLTFLSLHIFDNSFIIDSLSTFLKS